MTPVRKDKKEILKRAHSGNIVRVKASKPKTSKNTWKNFERVAAKFFGTKRVPLSGSNSGHGTNSDSLHPDLYIEAKLREKHAIWSLFIDTEKKAKVENKVPIVAIKQKHQEGFLVVMRPEDILKIAKIVGDVG